MGVLDWLRRLILGQPKRDVSRLGGPGDDLDPDLIDESVDTSGGPLKEHHLRRALRDPKLLPKRKGLRLRRKRRLFTREEADRLFAATLRTRDRNIRDLLPDDEQLARYGLPLWRTEADLAHALGVSVRELRFFSVHRQRERARHYVTFSIPKRSGGRRLIQAPKKRLKALQRRLLPLIVDRLPVSDWAHGFREHRSIRTGAQSHVGKAVLVQMDLADFFPSVTYARVRGLLIALGYGYPVAAVLATLMSESVRQPVDVDGTVFHVPVGPRHCVQGAPTSPGLCNAVTLRLDRRLAGLARHYGFSYTRYADDLTFSGEDAGSIGPLLRLATEIIGSEGFRVNTKKTRVSRRGQRQRVTGVTVNDVLGLSRSERRRLRATIHRLRAAPAPAAQAKLDGQLAYLNMLNPDQAAGLRRDLRR